VARDHEVRSWIVLDFDGSSSTLFLCRSQSNNQRYKSDPISLYSRIPIRHQFAKAQIPLLHAIPSIRHRFKLISHDLNSRRLRKSVDLHLLVTLLGRPLPFADVDVHHSRTVSDVHFNICPIEQCTMSFINGPWPHNQAF